MNGICRICLIEGCFISVFELDGCIQISHKIMSVTRIKMDQRDGLPSAICTTCLLRTNESYTFKEECERTDRKLRQRCIDNKNITPQTNSTNPNHLSSEENKNNNVIKILELSCVSEGNADIIVNSKDTHNSNAENDLPECNFPEEKLQGNNCFMKDSNCINLVDKNKIKSDIKETNTEEIVKQDYIKLEKSKNYKMVKDKCDDKKERRKTTTEKQQCVICGKIISSRFCLKQHMRTHSGEKPFPCLHCAKSFSQGHSLKLYLLTHSGQRPVQCGTCGRRFTQAATLAAHIRLHTGEAPYGCYLCSKRFRTRGHLHYHIRQHKGEKRFECATCGRAFLARGDLTQHTRTHSGDKPFVCSVCGKRLTRASNLARHMRAHDGVRPFKCDICSAAYGQKVHLKRHLLKKHDDDK